MKISYLAEHPQFIDALAPLVSAQLRPIDPEETLDGRVEKLHAHLNRDILPIAWIAHSKSRVFGTAALRVKDLPGREDLTPWPGGVFVVPRYRGRGIGAALCEAVERKAASIDTAPRLYLFTLDKQAWYSRLGWEMYESCSWCGHPGDIMVKSPAAPNNHSTGRQICR